MARLKIIIAVLGWFSCSPFLPRPGPDRGMRFLCPECKSDHVVYILYGEPILDDDLKRAIESGKVELGGCMITPESQRWECRECRHSWGSVQAVVSDDIQ